MYRYLQWSSNNQGNLRNTKSINCDNLRLKSWQTPRQVVLEENIKSTQFQWEEKRATIFSAKNTQFIRQQNLGQPYSKWKYSLNNAFEKNHVTSFMAEVTIHSVHLLT